MYVHRSYSGNRLWEFSVEQRGGVQHIAIHMPACAARAVRLPHPGAAGEVAPSHAAYPHASLAPTTTRKVGCRKPRRCSRVPVHEPGRHEAALNLAAGRQPPAARRRGESICRPARRRGPRSARRESSTRSRRGRLPTCTPRWGGLPSGRPRRRRHPRVRTGLVLCRLPRHPGDRLARSRREMGWGGRHPRARARAGRATTIRGLGRVHLGLAYYAAGRRDDAAAEWRAALAEAPGILVGPGPTGPRRAGGKSSGPTGQPRIDARRLLLLRRSPCLLKHLAHGTRRPGRAHIFVDREAGPHDAASDRFVVRHSGRW